MTNLNSRCIYPLCQILYVPMHLIHTSRCTVSSPHELLVEIMAALQNVDVLSWCIHSFSVLMERIARMTKQCPMVLNPIHPTQQHITCSLIPMAAWYDTTHYYTKSIAVCLLQCIQYYLVASFTLHIQESMYDFQHYYFQMQTWMSSQRMCVVLYISFSYIIPHQHYYDNLQYHRLPVM